MSGVIQMLLAGVKKAVVDPFFNYVTLLLPGNGTNGAQNNTFVDSSTNAFTITRNGNTTQGTFSPFSQTGWGAYFDGNLDYLSGFTQQNLSDFTCECWFYRGEDVTGYHIIFGGPSSSGAGNCQLFVNNSGAVGAALNGAAAFSPTGTAVTKNQWNHIAYVRSGSTLSVFVNGSRIVTASNSAQLQVAYISYLGGQAGGAYEVRGYLSDVRIANAAIYDPSLTTLTVPTAPLTAVSGTQLLTLQSNRFVDNSANAYTVTPNGNTSIQAFSPFNPTAAWSAATNGGSGYFDGSGDYLSGIGTTSSFNFMHDSSALWTFECWVYLPSPSTNQYILDNCDGSTAQIGVLIGVESSKLYFAINRGASGTSVASGSSTDNVPANQWVHIAITYDQSLGSSNGKFYINGVASGTVNKTANAPSGSNASNAMRVGAFASGSGPVTGYLSNLRISNSIVYSSAFTPPTSPVTGGSLLLNYTNAGIYDATSKNDLETVGNAQISTTQSKFGGSSMYFDGTGDRLITRDSPITRIGTAPFTIEAWIYPTNVSPASNFTIIAKGTSSAAGTWQFDITSASKLRFQYDAAGAITSSASLTANVWTHVVVVREGTGSNQTKLYINGSNDGTGTISSDLNTTAIVKIGQNRDSTTDYPGYIQDLRLTNGIARYTTGFTPPTAAFPLSGPSS